MTATRMEGFSDAVIAIVITIMVLELAVPEAAGWDGLREVIPGLLTYVLSFVFLGINWNNHHHLLYACDRMNGKILWANLHILFWLSLVPFVTRWMRESDFAELPTAVYGGVLFLAAVAWLILQKAILAEQGRDSRLARALERDVKGKASPALYFTAIPLAFVNPSVSIGIYVLVALLWFVPDRRIEMMERE